MIKKQKVDNNDSNDFNESNINGGSFDNYNINSFDSLINEFKLRTSVNIEESIILFFKIISIDSNKFNIKFKNSDTKTIYLNLKSVNEREKKKIGNKNIEDIIEKAVILSKDHSGSRLVQRKYEEGKQVN